MTKVPDFIQISPDLLDQHGYSKHGKKFPGRGLFSDTDALQKFLTKYPGCMVRLRFSKHHDRYHEYRIVVRASGDVVLEKVAD